MADIISIDYEQMKTISNQFNDQSQNVQRMVEELRGQMDTLSGGGWIADAADAFYASMNDDVLLGVDRLCNALVQASETCNKISVKMEQSEDDACSCIPGG